VIHTHAVYSMMKQLTGKRTLVTLSRRAVAREGSFAPRCFESADIIADFPHGVESAWPGQ
jgi:hypothetical protein